MSSHVSMLFIFIAFLVFSNAVVGIDITVSYDSSLEKELLESWKANQTEYDTLQAWLIADGIKDQTKINNFKNECISFTKKIQKDVVKEKSDEKKAQKIFKLLNKKVLKKPNDKSTLIELFSKGTYNGITGSAIYYYICTKFGLPVQITYTGPFIFTQLNTGDQIITIDILDKKHGFDIRLEDEDIQNAFTLLGYWNKIEQFTESNLTLDMISELRIIEPYVLSGVFYYNSSLQFLEYGNAEYAVRNFEKALLFDPYNVLYQQIYKYCILSLYVVDSNPDKYLPYFKNAVLILKDDPSFVPPAISIANEILFNLTEEKHNYKEAFDLAKHLKKDFVNEQFLKAIIETETKLKYNQALTLYNRGEMKTAYSIMKNLYSQDTSSYKTKDTFVNMSIDYAKDLIRQNKKYEMANSIMDTLIYLVPNYAIVKDSYLEILLAPFHFEYLFSKENPQKALEIAKKAFKMFPNNEQTKFVIAGVCHDMAMRAIRNNDLRSAHKILVEGLKYVPENKMLNEDFEQVIDAM